MIEPDEILNLGYEYHQDNDAMKDEDVFRWPNESPYWLILKQGIVSVQTPLLNKDKIKLIRTKSFKEFKNWHDKYEYLRK